MPVGIGGGGGGGEGEAGVSWGCKSFLCFVVKKVNKEGRALRFRYLHCLQEGKKLLEI